MATPTPKPQDQPNPDAALLQGGPEGTPPAAPVAPKPDAPQTVAVKYGGKEYVAPPELAAAWEARELEFGKKLSEHGQELGDLRRFRESVTKTVTPPPPQRDLGTMLFENPNQALTQLREEIKTEVRQEYAQDQGQRQFWGAFYRKHEDLDGEDTLVKAVMQQHWGELSVLPVSSAQDKIADLTRSEILRISKKLKGGSEEELPQGRAIVEGVGTPSPKRTPAEPAEPKRLSDIIRENRKRRLSPQASPKG